MLLDYWLYNHYNKKSVPTRREQMEKINDEFNIPYYIFEEIVEYVEQTAKGKCKCMKWENVKSLLNLAVKNKRMTERQAEHLKKECCRE